MNVGNKGDGGSRMCTTGGNVTGSTGVALESISTPDGCVIFGH